MLGCSDEKSESYPIFYNANSPITINIENAPTWVQESTLEAVGFWAARNHAVSFTIDPNGKIPIGVKDGEQLPEEALGIYTFDGKIYLNSSLENNIGAKCVIAHELGHSIQMNHVSKSGGMMSVYASIWADGRCMWNGADTVEFNRVLAL